jgi:hypothetical protein
MIHHCPPPKQQLDFIKKLPPAVSAGILLHFVGNRHTCAGADNSK